MSYTPVPFGPFSGGLNLRDSPGEVGGSEAIDCLNVLFSERGAVKQRDGYAQLTSSELTNQPDSVFAFTTSAGTKRLLVGNGNRIDALDTAGASQANSTAPTTSPHYFARFGGPTAESVYFGNGTDQVRKFTADVFSSPAGLAGQTGRFVAITPTSNRLVVARESGTTGGNNPSSVNFSDAGAPETFTSTSWIDLDPGDGEAITGVCVWGTYTFIFKESKFWVHYGESVDSTGLPVFQVRKIDTGAGLVASRALVVGLDGVYFMGRDGVYRTRGDAPEKLSDKIEPFFLGGASIYYKSSTLNHGSITAAAGAWHDNRLWLSVPTGSSSTNDRTLVFDPQHGWWSLLDIPAAALTRFRVGNQAELVFAAPAGSNYIYRHASAYSADAMSTTGTGGSAITARWRSGWVDFGSDSVKTIRESKVWGTGGLGLKVYFDFRDLAPTTTTVALSASVDTWGDGTGTDTWGSGASTDDLWGPTGTLTVALVRYATRGTTFSTEFVNSTLNRTFSIHRLHHHLREQRPPSTMES